MDNATEKKTHGGARAGAGRKSTDHGKYYGFNSTKEVEVVLEGIGKGKTQFINAAIAAYAKQMGIL